jgi:hypothetical protein
LYDLVAIGESIGTCIGVGITIIISIYTYLKRAGYIKIWKTKLTGVTYEEAKAIQGQNGNALVKLNMSDELVDYLQQLAPSEDGTIDEEAAVAALRDCIKWNNHLIKKIPHISEVEKKE